MPVSPRGAAIPFARESVGTLATCLGERLKRETRAERGRSASYLTRNTREGAYFQPPATIAAVAYGRQGWHWMGSERIIGFAYFLVFFLLTFFFLNFSPSSFQMPFLLLPILLRVFYFASLSPSSSSPKPVLFAMISLPPLCLSSCTWTLSCYSSCLRQ